MNTNDIFNQPSPTASDLSLDTLGPTQSNQIHTKTKVAETEAAENHKSGINLLNINDAEVVYHRFLIVDGLIVSSEVENGQISIKRDKFPDLTYAVVENNFKAIVELGMGDNTVTFQFTKADSTALTRSVKIRMESNLRSMPVRLGVVYGKDSQMKYDMDPTPENQDPKDWINSAISKLRCAAYLWQAFTAYEMQKNGFGWRTFRFEEENTLDTMNNQNPTTRSIPKVCLLPSEETVTYIRDKQRAEQWVPSSGEERTIFDTQLDVASNALDKSKETFKNSKHYIAVLTLDSTWPKADGIVLGHAALSSQSTVRNIAVHGSHMLYAWPSCIQDVVKCFSNTTKVNEDVLYADKDGVKEYWMRYHPLFMLPKESAPPPRPPARIIPYPADNSIFFECSDGIVLIECFIDNELKAFSEFTLENLPSRKSEKTPTYTDQEKNMENPTLVKVDLEVCKTKIYGYIDQTLNFVVTCNSQSNLAIVDAAKFISDNTETPESGIKIFSYGVHGKKDDQSKKQDVLFLQDSPDFLKLPAESTLRSLSKISLIKLFLHTNNSNIGAFEVTTKDGKKTMLGNYSTSYKTTKSLTIVENDGLKSVDIRSGVWIDGMEFKSRNGRTTSWLGGNGGVLTTSQPPPGYVITGLRVYYGGWVDGLTLLYSKQA
ncbi:hypothetical protein BB560_003347 [Smittium megazygosporum]|uniref:Jacalin-type lectin domain-containing protein n=1 Tax=Smittium megazygosporum TaxID=133381 RepID=A0A2T9ZC92_9FUNG|nr:hypothetical protein BB560_003347 [Smittium megazygosporum]